MLSTKTINPLPFEHLEPHRFEDLVRQLIYDFKDWEKLEATGRSGNDNGFDIMGSEVINKEDENEKNKIWLVQCKREQNISPKKLERYLKACLENKTQIYGIIFAASCNFSNTARDRFRNICRQYQIEEYYIFGKAELEDMLFQAKNDRLLFAYFGISLSIKRRSLKSQINAKLSIKNKSKNLPENDAVLLRDPTDTFYPSTNIDQLKRKWKIYKYEGQDPKGLIFLVGKYFAYFNDNTQEWDYIKSFMDRDVFWKDPWDSGPFDQEIREKRNRYQSMWKKLPQENQALYWVYGLILYEDVIAIDEQGDRLFKNPHIYVEFQKQNPFKISCNKITVYNEKDNKEYCVEKIKKINFFSDIDSH